MVTAQCPYCFATDEVPDEYAGRVTKCLTCGKSFTIKFVPTLYRESATPVVVTPKKAIHMGASTSGKPRAAGNGAEQPIDAQSREIFAEITETASVHAPESSPAKSSRPEASLVDELGALDTAFTLIKAAVGVWLVGLSAFCCYAGINGHYVQGLAAFGVIVLLGVALHVLRVSGRALTNVTRAILDVQREIQRAHGEQCDSDVMN